MGLKVDVNQLLNVNKVINEAAEVFNDILAKANNKHDELYHKVKARSSVNFSSLNTKSTTELSTKMNFIAITVKTLEEALGENVDKILSHQPPLTNDDYEHYIIKDYVNRHKDSIDKVGLRAVDGLDMESGYTYLYDMVHKKGAKYYYDAKVVKYSEIGNFLDRFKYSKGIDFSFGLSEKEVYDEFLILYQKRGNDNVKIMFDKLIEFYPQNFNDLGLTLDMFDKNGYAEYKYNGHRVLLHQDMLQNAFTNKIESIMNLFVFGSIINVFNEMGTKVTDTILNNTGELPFIIEISEKSAEIERLTTYGNGSPVAYYWGRYYALEDENHKVIEGGITGSLGFYLYDSMFGSFSWAKDKDKRDNGVFESKFSKETFRSVFIHELGHALDAAMQGGYSVFSTYGKNYEVWKSLFDRFKDKLKKLHINRDVGYLEFDNLPSDKQISEFFAEVMRAFIENPDELNTEEFRDLYNAIQSMLNNL